MRIARNHEDERDVLAVVLQVFSLMILAISFDIGR
jgi:hypothetical protein